METINEVELRKLAETQGPNCVSIYMPTHRRTHETQQDSLRLKVLLGQAEDSLVAQGMRAPEASEMLEAARELIGQTQFWSHQGDGLAVLITPADTATYRLPREFEEVCLVSDRFLLTPLIPLINENEDFFILAISPGRVRLLTGSRDEIEEVEVEGLPKNFEELGKYIDTERLLQFHTRAAPTGAVKSPRAAVFHGQGVGVDDAAWKKQLLDFCHMIERNLQSTLADRKIPLVLAGDQSFLSLFDEANTYEHTLEKAVIGNPDELSEKELRDLAWPIVREQKQQEKAEVLSKFGQASADQLASTEVNDILLSAIDGRVDTLLIAKGSHAWGTCNQEAREVSLHQERQQGDQDLINLAAVNAFLHGGEVYAFDAGEMPEHSALAATYRYPIA